MPIGELLASSERQGKGRIVRVRDAAVAGMSLYQLATNLYANVEERLRQRHYTVKVEDEDDLFETVQDWLVGCVSPRRMHDVTAFSAQELSYDPEADTQRRIWKVRLEASGENKMHVTLEGHRIEVTYHPPQDASSSGESLGRINPQRRRIVGFLTFTASDLDGRDAIIRHIDKLVRAQNTEEGPTSRVFAASNWGGWKRLGGPPRPLSSVVLREGVKERLVADVKRFLSLERYYATIGQPWHRGYLLYGPPGGGKTSVFRALAGDLGLDLYYASLSDLTRNADLVDMFSSVSERSILLLEDVDGVRATYDEDDAEGRGISMAGLLNALDGVITPHGMILGMTTNHREKIDPRLLRRGRVDLEVFIDVLDGEQLDQLVSVLLGVDATFPDYREELGLTAADAVEVIKSNLDRDDPKYSVEGIRDLIEERGSDGPEG